jgi:hypothetical protein
VTSDYPEKETITLEDLKDLEAECQETWVRPNIYSTLS